MIEGLSVPAQPQRAGLFSFQAMRRALALALLSVLAPASRAALAASVLPPDAHVATLELAAPATSAFVLRGTVPIPLGTYPRADGALPFRVRDADGSLVDAQVEVVSRSGATVLEAQVVELLARVHRPAGAQTGDRLRYDVVLSPHADDELFPSPFVSALLATPGQLVLRATDAFGNVYLTDLREDALVNTGDRIKQYRSGSWAETLGTHQILLPAPPVAGAAGTLPHHLGVHSYVTRWSREEFVSLDLRLHNAMSGLRQDTTDDDALGKLYFGKLELLVPQGWAVLNDTPDPYFGAAYDEGPWRVQPIVAPLAGGKLHVIPSMAQFERRLVVARNTPAALASARVTLEADNLAFCVAGNASDGRELWSWWNRDTAFYFPQRHVLPRLDTVPAASLRVSDEQAFAGRAQQVASGAPGLWPATSAGLGWAHPWGVSDGGMVSGQEIWLYDGIATAWAASHAGYRHHALRHRMYTDRQCNVLFNVGGRHMSVLQWRVTDPVHGDWMPVWWFGGPLLFAADPFGFGIAPTFQSDWVAQQGKQPAYEAELLAYRPIDESHLGRYTHDTKVLVWLGNDPLAKDDLRAQAEGFRLGFCELPQDIWGGIVSSGLHMLQNYVAARPGQGLAFGRREGWGIDTVCAAYSTQSDHWREPVRHWADMILDVVEAGQADCNGGIQASWLYNAFGAQYRCRQAIEAAISENGLVSLRESVYRRADNDRLRRLNGVLQKSWEAMVSPVFWSSANHAPWSLVAVGPWDSTQPLFCTTIPPDGNAGYTDAFQCPSSLAYAYELTGNPVFLARATEMVGGPLTTVFLANPLDNLENTAALVALSQTLP